MEPIKETIQAVFQGWQARNKKGTPLEPAELLKKILAKKALKHVQLYNFRKGILSVKVDSAAWLYYLNLQKEDLLSRLHKESETIQGIRFSLGE
jgi:hypothetical protein